MNRWYWFLRVHNRTKKKWKWVLCAYEHNEHSVRVLAKKMRLHSVWVDRSTIENCVRGENGRVIQNEM
jgi:hypothetical protein